jgi:hypothetical protein
MRAFASDAMFKYGSNIPTDPFRGIFVNIAILHCETVVDFLAVHLIRTVWLPPFRKYLQP